MFKSPSPLFDGTGGDILGDTIMDNEIRKNPTFEYEESSIYIANYNAEAQLGRIIVNGLIQDMQDMVSVDSPFYTLFKGKTYHQSIQVANSLLTMAKFAGIQGGLGIESAYTLYESYLEKTDDCHSMTDLTSTVYSALIEYTSEVDRLHSMTRKQYSAPINRAIAIIMDKMPEKITLEDVAVEVHLTPKYLSALFIKETGESFCNYVRDIRIQNAKKLLETSDMSLLEITNLLNFSSQSYFNHIFKQKTGMTPKEFKNSQQTQ